jgi:hypothetical protein
MLFSRTRTADFLSSLGFSICCDSEIIPLPDGFNSEQLRKNRFHRNECRKHVTPEVYGKIFEQVVQEVLISGFRFDVLRDVSIQDEGSGGDFDLLAFQSPHLHSVECKISKRNIKFEHVLERHHFLRPSMTIVLIDQEAEQVKDIVSNEVQRVLTRYDRSQNAALPADYTHQVRLIWDNGFRVYHATRNIFVASGEDLDRAIRRCLRYFHQWVSQTTYPTPKPPSVET